MITEIKIRMEKSSYAKECSLQIDSHEPTQFNNFKIALAVLKQVVKQDIADDRKLTSAFDMRF